ncbi:inorganic phosphate transporter, PiT family [Thermosulfidibacter takaii ABI70S6]|uniref:Phosphate transporter n=1 Tax=Thermosulfidibacter takaii (strain DSM 17441 / JCM 13301 / NBRC 103674 / ABI70S6) TaxID=1298851 RepID=A0A0S3QRF7_THET7|nr:inorganic phosphate transporter [Thermosulfidibacter takaii]BAT70903.1 inorganic phosphate transporter, PiT family [Thermosulfidibacter takaii ABI70S6]
MNMYIIGGIALLAGMYMAWNIGANDVANAMGTSVGSKAITLKKAIIIAAIFEFSGAFFVGSHVTSTISKGIVDPMLFQDNPNLFILGMLAALISAGIWVQLATYLGLPVSTTHSIVGAVVGFGIVSKGLSAIEWGKMVSIVLSWIISPIAGGLIAFLMFRWITKNILATEYPAKATRKYGPYLVSMVVFIIALSIVYKGLKLHLPLFKAVLLALVIAFIFGTAFKFLVFSSAKSSGETIRQRLYETEELFKYLQLATACYMAFAHGANDVANATGPMAGIITTMAKGVVVAKAYVPDWVLLLGGLGIVMGLATWGYKVIETIGGRITDITPSRGFCAEFGCATTVLVCSKMGLPISTTHTLVGSVIGVGFARGIGALNMRTIKQIVNSWIITVPFTAGLCVFIYAILKALFI